MKGSGNSPKQNRPTQDNSWQNEQAQSQNAGQNNSNRHNNNPENAGSSHHAGTYSHNHPDGSSHQNSGNANQQNSSTGPGVSGRPNSMRNQSTEDSTNRPHFQDGPVAGGADNTRGENVPSREGHGGGAKKGKFNPEAKSPQGSNANWSDTRGADSSDKEFKNNQPNASTLKGHKSNENLGNEKE